MRAAEKSARQRAQLVIARRERDSCRRLSSQAWMATVDRLRFPSCLALALAGALAACTVNRPLEEGGVAPSPAYRYATVESASARDRNSEEVLVIVALSGGGARAAALGYGVLEALAATRIRPAPLAVPRSVLDEVDLISANSGGAFLAAYYAVHREAMFRSALAAARRSSAIS